MAVSPIVASIKTHNALMWVIILAYGLSKEGLPRRIRA